MDEILWEPEAWPNGYDPEELEEYLDSINDKN